MINNNFEDGQSILLDLVRFFLALMVVLGRGIGFFFGYFDVFFPRVFPYPQSIAFVCFFICLGI